MKKYKIASAGALVVASALITVIAFANGESLQRCQQSCAAAYKDCAERDRGYLVGGCGHAHHLCMEACRRAEPH